MQTFFKTLEEFYDDNTERRRSPEADYGVMWKISASHHPFRVSYIRDTGEIYAVQQGPEIGPVHLLGQVPADQVVNERTDLYYQTLEDTLAGWPEQSMQKDNLVWITNRLQNAGYPAYTQP